MATEGIEVLTPDYARALVFSRADTLGLPLDMPYFGHSFEYGLMATVNLCYQKHLVFAVARDVENAKVLADAFKEKKCAFVEGQHFGSVTFLHPERGFKEWIKHAELAGVPAVMLASHLKRLCFSLYSDSVVLALVECANWSWYNERFEHGAGPSFNAAANEEA